MPALFQKASVLEGRGQVLAYKRDPSAWYYRELIKGTERYRSARIPDATTLEQAVEAALDMYGSFRETIPGTAPERPRRATATQALQARKRKGKEVAEAVADYLKFEQRRVDAQELGQLTLKDRRQVLTTHLLAYLKDQKVSSTAQISSETFHEYGVFRHKASKLTRNKEITIIKGFIDNHLRKHKLIDPEVAIDKNLIPKARIKTSDLDANPAINPEDWGVINRYIRHEWVEKVAGYNRPSVFYWRHMFWTFTLVAKNTGCRPKELLALRWKDVEIVDVGRISKSKEQGEIEALEAEGIDVLDANEPNDYQGWSKSEKAIGRVERLIAYVMVRNSKTGEQREIPANIGNALRRFHNYQKRWLKEHGQPNLLNTNSLIFGNPGNEMRPYNYSVFGKSWNKIIEAVKDKLKGHKFSERSYSIYSMRSTFIENNLAGGMDIFLLARICGHSVHMLTKHYERMDIRMRAEEITHISFGNKRKDGEIQIRLFETNTL